MLWYIPFTNTIGLAGWLRSFLATRLITAQIYWVGPIMGALLATGFYKFIKVRVFGIVLIGLPSTFWELRDMTRESSPRMHFPRDKGLPETGKEILTWKP